ncbi:hypothetical protein D3C81_819070 [compost metagenome]
MWNVFIGVFSGLYLALQFSLVFLSFSPDAAAWLDKNTISLLKDVVGPASTGFGGAIAGAYAAFYFQGYKEKSKEVRDGYRILSMTKLEFLRRIQYLLAIKKNSIDKFKDHEFRFLAVLELPETAKETGVVGLEILDYLLAVKAKTAVHAVLNASHNYEVLFDSMKGRNRTYSGYRDTLNSSSLGRNFKVDFPRVVSVVEPGRILAVYRRTEQALKGIDDVIGSIYAAVLEVENALDGYFEAKGFPVIDFDILEEGFLKRLPPPFHTEESLKQLISEISARETADREQP